MEKKEYKNESFTDWMKSVCSFFIPVFIILMLAASARALEPQYSADYLFSTESNDGGGSPAASADYSSDDSTGAGNFVSSADYAQRSGYIGQLPNAPVATNYSLTVNSNTVIKIPIAALLKAVKDVDGDSITFVSVAGGSAQNGVVSRVGNFIVYSPESGFTGSDSIVWVAQDSEGDRTTETILALVGAPPAPLNLPTLNLVSITFDSTPGATDATLRFAGLPQSTYTVQYTGNLVSPVTWTTLGTVSVTNGVFLIVDPTAGSASQRYYRTLFQSQ
jgi:hypothetical protein